MHEFDQKEFGDPVSRWRESRNLIGKIGTVELGIKITSGISLADMRSTCG